MSAKKINYYHFVQKCMFDAHFYVDWELEGRKNLLGYGYWKETTFLGSYMSCSIDINKFKERDEIVLKIKT